MSGTQAGDEENATIQEPLLNPNYDSNVDTLASTLVTDEGDEEEEDNLPDVPLEPYISYVKFFFHFAKWILPVVVFDFIAMIVSDSGNGTEWNRSVFALVLIINTVAFFFAAMVIDRDVAKVDEESRTEEGSGRSEALPIDWNNYENIHGKVARKVDEVLASACQVHPVTTQQRPAGTTSFLSHMCWIVWAFLFASAFSETFELGYDHLLPDVKERPEASNDAIVSDISHFPENLQKWITTDRDEDEEFDFPTTITDYYNPLLLKDRFITWRSQSTFTELVAVNSKLEKREHYDIGNAYAFIPVQNSLDKKDSHRAKQFCFLSNSDDDCVAKVHCIDDSKMENGKALVLKNTTAEFDICQHRYPSRLEAASYKDQVFFSTTRYPFCQEVIQLDTKTMETSTIYYKKCGRDGDDRYEFVPFSYTLVFNGFIGIFTASYYIIAKRGMVSGFFPLMTAFSYLLNLVTSGMFVFLLLISGTVFFHYAIFTDCSWRYLPAWVGKDVYKWSLYGWISSIAISEILPFVPYSLTRHVDAGWVIVCYMITGIILGHPMLQAVGYIFVLASLWLLINEFNYILGDPIEWLTLILAGLGMIVLGNWLAAHRDTIYARSQYALWYLTKWFRNRYRRRLRRRS